MFMWCERVGLLPQKNNFKVHNAKNGYQISVFKGATSLKICLIYFSTQNNDSSYFHVNLFENLFEEAKL